MEFCYQTAQIWQLVGKAIYILKILIPIILIVLGMIDFGKAVISSDEKALKNTTKKLIKKIIAGICIFFIPLLIQFVFSMISLVSDEMKKDYTKCIDCLTDPYNTCDTTYEGNIFSVK